MYNLLIDQGNTQTKFFVCTHDYKILYKQAIVNAPEQQAQVLHLLNELIENNVSYAIYSSVSGLNKLIIKQIQGLKYHLIFNNTTPIPIHNLYKSKHTLGMDRLAGAIGANFLFPNTNLLIIDIGTAITYDFVDKNNNFLGGNISPGPFLRFRALNTFTTNLPLVNISEPQRLIGQSTKEAILNGVVYGIKAEIEGFITYGQKKFSQIKPILTGGYADFFGKIFKNYIFVQANLVPIGLNRVLEFNKNFVL